MAVLPMGGAVAARHESLRSMTSGARRTLRADLVQGWESDMVQGWESVCLGVMGILLLANQKHYKMYRISISCFVKDSSLTSLIWEISFSGSSSFPSARFSDNDKIRLLQRFENKSKSVAITLKMNVTTTNNNNKINGSLVRILSTIFETPADEMYKIVFSKLFHNFL